MSPRGIKSVSWVFILIGLSANTCYVVFALSSVCATAFAHLFGATGLNGVLKIGHAVICLHFKG